MHGHNPRNINVDSITDFSLEEVNAPHIASMSPFIWRRLGRIRPWGHNATVIGIEEKHKGCLWISLQCQTLPLWSGYLLTYSPSEKAVSTKQSNQRASLVGGRQRSKNSLFYLKKYCLGESVDGFLWAVLACRVACRVNFGWVPHVNEVHMLSWSASLSSSRWAIFVIRLIRKCSQTSVNWF